MFFLYKKKRVSYKIQIFLRSWESPKIFDGETIILFFNKGSIYLKGKRYFNGGYI